MSNIYKLLHDTILVSGSLCYYHFFNADGKEWLIPRDGLSVGLALYQPSSWKGRLLKRMVSTLGRLGIFRHFLHMKEVYIQLAASLRKGICQAFCVDNFLFSIFGGTPSIHQKITVQVFTTSGQILGYCKVTTQQDIWQNFQKEYSLLEDLHQKGVSNIPQGLYCGRLESGLYIFVQSTIKTLKSKYPHEWQPMHERFLANLSKKTKQIMPFEDTDFFKALQLLEQRLDWLSVGDAEIIGRAISRVRREHVGKLVVSSMFHGDFTPWNMFVEKGELFAFDWEYAMRTCPPGLDYYHFFTQSLVFEKHYNTKQIWQAYKQIKNSDEEYLCYLLLIMALYLKRERKDTLPQIEEKMLLWIDQIKRIVR